MTLREKVEEAERLCVGQWCLACDGKASDENLTQLNGSWIYLHPQCHGAYKLEEFLDEALAFCSSQKEVEPKEVEPAGVEPFTMLGGVCVG